MRYSLTQFALSVSFILFGLANASAADMEPTAEMSRSVKADAFDKEKLHYTANFSFQSNKTLNFERGTGKQSDTSSMQLQFQYEGSNTFTAQGRSSEEQMVIHTIKDDKGRSLISGSTKGVFHPATYESVSSGRRYVGSASLTGLIKPQADAETIAELSVDLLLKVVSSTRIVKLSPLADFIDKGLILPDGVITIKSVTGTNVKIEMRGKGFNRNSGYQVHYFNAEGKEIRRSGYGSSGSRNKITYTDRIREALGDGGYIEISYPEETDDMSFPVRLKDIPLSTEASVAAAVLNPETTPVAEGLSLVVSELRRSRSRHLNFDHPNSSRPRESFMVRMDLKSAVPGVKVNSSIPGAQAKDMYQVDEVVDDTGKNLITDNINPYLSISSSSRSSKLGYFQFRNLDFPADGAKYVKRIKGNLFMMMLKDFKSVTVDGIADQVNNDIEIKPMGKIKITEHKGRTLRLRTTFKAINSIKLSFVNPDGTPVSHYTNSTSMNANSATQKISLRADLDPKASLIISYPSTQEVVRVPFELKDIPLFDAPKAAVPQTMPPANANYSLAPQSMDMEDSSTLRFRTGSTQSSSNEYMNIGLALSSKQPKVIVPHSGSSQGDQGLIWEAVDDTGKSLLKNEVYLSVNPSSQDGAAQKGRIGTVSMSGLKAPSVTAKAIKELKGWFRVKEVKSYKHHAIALSPDTVGKTYMFNKHAWMRIDSLKGKILVFRTNFSYYPGSGGFSLSYVDATGNAVSASRSTSSSDGERVYTETFTTDITESITLKTAFPEETVEVRLPIHLTDIPLSPSAPPAPVEEAQLREYETAIESLQLNQGFSVNHNNGNYHVYRGDGATMKLNIYHDTAVTLARYRSPSGSTPLYIDAFTDSTGKNLAAGQLSMSLSVASGKSHERHRLGYAWIHNILLPAPEATHITAFSGHALFYEMGEMKTLSLALTQDNFGKAHTLSSAIDINLKSIEQTRLSVSFSERDAFGWVELSLKTADGKTHKRRSYSGGSGVYRLDFGVEPTSSDTLVARFPSRKTLVKVPFSYTDLKLNLPAKAPKPKPQMPANDKPQMQGNPAVPMGVGDEVDG